MKKALCMLIFGLAFNSCDENSADRSCTRAHIKKEISAPERSAGTKHLISDKDCHIINEWLNRKNMSHFLKNHISLETTINRFIDKTHLNDTFI